MRRVPKKIEELISIVSAIPSAIDASLALGFGRRYNQNQIIASSLAGALIAVSKDTQYEELCSDIITKCVAIDSDGVIDKDLLGFEDSNE